MSIIVLNATQWSYESDLDSPPARWSAEFLESGSGAHLPGESTSRLGRDRVAIDVTVEGFTSRLTEGAVREWGFREDPDLVVSLAQGIDLKATLLDFKPSAPTTFRGIQLLSTSSSPTPAGAVGTVTLGIDCAGNSIVGAYFTTFQRAAAQVASAAGYTPTFDCYDYVLGQDVVWTTDQSANDVISQMASPFNATERFKLDVFAQANDVLRFVERGRSSPPLVQIDYGQLSGREIRETPPPPQWAVQVVGPVFTAMEPDCSAGQEPGTVFVPPGQTPEPYTKTFRSEEREGFDSGDTGSGSQVLISDTTTIQYFDRFGRLTRVVKQKFYHNYVVRDPRTGNGIQVRPKPRTEDTLQTFEYLGPQGQMTRSVETTFVTDNTDHYEFDLNALTVVLKYVSRFAQTTAITETRTEYDEDTGDVIHSLSTTFRGEPEKVPISQVPNILTFAQESRGTMMEHQLEEWFFWSGGQRLRQWENRTFDRDTPGKVLKVSKHIEPATGVGRQEKTFIVPVAPGPDGTRAMRQRTVEIKAGPDSANLRVSLPMLGTEADCEYFRQRILLERQATRYEGNFTMVPDLNILEGYTLQVLNAPARWRANIFYLTSRGAEHDTDLMSMRLRGLAWL